MVKLLGAILILFAGTMIGFQQAARFAERPRQLRQLAHALQRLETEIGYGYTPLDEALRRASHALAEPAAALFADAAARLSNGGETTFREAWEAALAEHWPRTSMKRGEHEVMLQLGTLLGISDREDQMKHLRLALLQLQSEEEAAREDQVRYEKMCKSLGILAAALIVILMV
ncbi:stage III sporulation protein SpoIIIAB [Paenibacillus daejeonensis]|uniref:stage III sporulation protein SpoIIIAB n=1 Tax=Paenibacillus daejeonensis TaxID=135193 RepID=UPI000360D33B|nr:stage III sporulation protein SpoIIIAB [Paenibacillus daejeonensis]